MQILQFLVIISATREETNKCFLSDVVENTIYTKICAHLLRQINTNVKVSLVISSLTSGPWVKGCLQLVSDFQQPHARMLRVSTNPSSQNNNNLKIPPTPSDTVFMQSQVNSHVT